MTATRQVALVTGASSGIGKATAIALAAAGFQVIGTGRNTARVTAPAGVTYLDLDVTSDESVASVVEQVIDRFGQHRRPGQQRRRRRHRRRRGVLRRPDAGRLRHQRLRRHADDQGGPAAHARSTARTHHQRLLPQWVRPQPVHGHLRLDQARGRGLLRSRWTTRSASTASGSCSSSPARSTPRSGTTACRPTPHCRSTRRDGAPSTRCWRRTPAAATIPPSWPR